MYPLLGDVMNMEKEHNCDKSFYDKNGKCIFFSTDDFISKIVEKDNCFLCGVERRENTFNDEHILPNWILKKFQLHQKSITLPNLSQFRYDQYKIPCCIDCNSFLGKTVESYFSNLIRGGHEAIANSIIEGKSLNIFIWLALIFVKTHLKDRILRFYKDQRLGENKISELYEWKNIHHIYSVARAVYSDAIFDNNVQGSILILPAIVSPEEEAFDFSDNYEACSLYIKMDDFAIISVFNDSSACMQFITPILDQIKGPLNTLQLREVFAHMCFINNNLEERPKYCSLHNKETDEYMISCNLPKNPPRLKKFKKSEWGEYLYDFIPNKDSIKIMNKGKALNLEDIKNGNLTFLTDEDGNFINN